MEKQFTKTDEFGHLYNYAASDAGSFPEMAEKAYHYAVDILKLSTEIKIDIGDTGRNITRISAVMPNNTGYDFSKAERMMAAAYRADGVGWEDGVNDDEFADYITEHMGFVQGQHSNYDKEGDPVGSDSISIWVNDEETLWFVVERIEDDTDHTYICESKDEANRRLADLAAAYKTGEEE